jgi:type II secretory pathway pseudopilin PulG
VSAVRPCHPSSGLCAAAVRRRGERGYNLVILMVAVSVMLILVAAALPAWSTATRRDREEELVFRGLQYAEALRLFQQRFGRLPSRLEELLETEPRSIRQLWTDPFTGKVDWVLIRGNMPAAATISRNMDAGGGRSTEELEQRGDEEGEKPGGGEGSPGDGLPAGDEGGGEIRGVRSRHRGDALRTFFDKDRYEQWLFTVDLLLAGPPPMTGPGGDPTQPQGGGGGGGGMKLSARFLGRPFRPGLTPATAGQPPAGNGLPGSDKPQDLGGETSTEELE